MSTSLNDIIQKLDEIDDAKLNASNGTVTGPLTVKSTIQFTVKGALLKGSASSNGLHLYAGNNNHDGATIQLFDCNNANYPGQFFIRASTKSSSSDTAGSAPTLVGYPNGSLTWNGGEVWTSNGGKLSSSKKIDVTAGSIVSTSGNKLIYTNNDASIADTTRTAASYQMLAVGLDKDGKRGGGIEVGYYADGSRSILFSMRNRNDTTYHALSLKEDVNGNCYVYGRTPVSSANDTTVPTTQWCMSHGILVASSKSSTSFYRKYSDGWIEQGGVNTRTGTGDQTITLPTSMSNADWIIITGSNTGYSVIRSKTTTSFVLGSNTANTTYWYVCGY